MYGSQSVGRRWHQTVEIWTELSFCSASAWSEVSRTSSHRLSISGQNWVESGRNCAERRSCCSGYSRGCCCHPPLAACLCAPSYCVVEEPGVASCIDPCSGQCLVLAQNHESYRASWDYTWFGSLEEGVGRAAKTHHCRGAGLTGSGLQRAGWGRSRSDTAPGVAACPRALEL